MVRIGRNRVAAMTEYRDKRRKVRQFLQTVGDPTSARQVIIATHVFGNRNRPNRFADELAHPDVDPDDAARWSIERGSPEVV